MINIIVSKEMVWQLDEKIITNQRKQKRLKMVNVYSWMKISWTTWTTTVAWKKIMRVNFNPFNHHLRKILSELNITCKCVIVRLLQIRHHKIVLVTNKKISALTIKTEFPTKPFTHWLYNKHKSYDGFMVLKYHSCWLTRCTPVWALCFSKPMEICLPDRVTLK